MRISHEALEACEPLLQGYLQQVGVVNDFGYDLFRAVESHNSLFSETLRIISQYQSDRCRGAYCLLVNGLAWDAEIIIRTFYEAVAKNLFLSSALPEIQENLLKEYWEILPAIYDIKGADRADVAERLARRQGHEDNARVFAYLQNPDVFTLERIGNRQFRKEIEQRWSFSGIVSALNKNTSGHVRIASIDTLLHGYGMASHLAHASPKAMELMEDRATRGDDLKILEIAHVGRMLSDMISLTVFSLHQAQIALIGMAPMAKVLQNAFNAMAKLTAPFQEQFNRSQDGLYNATPHR